MIRYIPFAFLVFFTWQVQGHQYETCRSLDNNSCWHAVNESKKEEQLVCRNGFSPLLPSKSQYSYQFCSGLADGLGYSGSVVCSVGNDYFSFEFSYGDRIEIKILDEQVVVIMRKYWGSQETNTISFTRH